MVHECHAQLLAFHSCWGARSRWLVATGIPVTALSIDRPLRRLAEIVVRCRVVIPESPSIEMIACLRLADYHRAAQWYQRDYLPSLPHVRPDTQISMLGAPVGPGTDPGLFDAKKSVLRSGEIFGS